MDLSGVRRGSLRRHLEHELRTAVQSGRLGPGAALPSTRALSAQLGVSRGIVVETYEQLIAEGYLTSRQGAGTGVAAHAAEPVRALEAPAEQVWAAATRYDFSSGAPDLSAFPRSAWLAGSARTLRALADAQLNYGDPRGAIELRQALAAYLGRVRGVRADADRVLIGGGTRANLAFLWRVLRNAGATRVAIEDPGWRGQHETAIDGLQMVGVDVDDRGLRVDELAALDPDAVVVTPAHHCPTGAVLAPERRAALLAWAHQRDALIIEDDYDSEYRYDRDPIGALQGLAPERVIYAGSASKTLSPALRLGWLVLPTRLVGAAAEHNSLAGGDASLLDQLTLADLISRGDLDRHLRRMRLRYRSRRDALTKAVALSLPGAYITGIAAGLHALVRLPATADEVATVTAAAQHGIALVGLGHYCHHTPVPRPALVVGYANITEPAIARGINELAEQMR